MYVTGDILGTKDLIALGLVVSLAILLLVMGRRINLNVHGVSASIEKVKETVGEKNGNGAVTTMQARTLGELAELAAKVTEVNTRLDERTHILRQGRKEPEELAAYTQDRMHDVLTALSVLKLQLDTLWRFLKDDYQLPDLPSMATPDPTPTTE